MTHLNDYPVTVQLPVVWGEMDAFQHVNNVVYFRYFESARIAYFDEIQFTDTAKNAGVGPILASTSCRFRHPLRYPDNVVVGARVTELSTDRFTMRYRIISESLGTIAADGEGLIVSFDYSANRKTKVPKAIRQAIVSLEGEDLRLTDD